jgi:hypothetical protein
VDLVVGECGRPASKQALDIGPNAAVLGAKGIDDDSHFENRVYGAATAP